MKLFALKVLTSSESSGSAYRPPSILEDVSVADVIVEDPANETQIKISQ